MEKKRLRTVITSGLFTGNNYVTMETNIFNFIVPLFTNDSWVPARAHDDIIVFSRRGR